MLRQARADDSAETKKRVEALVANLEAGPNSEELRHSRCVELLELIGTDNAMALLADWAKGDESAVLTQSARQTLARKLPRDAVKRLP